MFFKGIYNSYSFNSHPPTASEKQLNSKRLWIYTCRLSNTFCLFLHLIPFYLPACKDTVLSWSPSTKSLAILIAPVFGPLGIDLSILNIEHWGTGYLRKVRVATQDSDIWMKVDHNWLGLFLSLAYLWTIWLLWGVCCFGFFFVDRGFFCFVCLVF